jgi:hypothetical protein
MILRRTKGRWAVDSKSLDSDSDNSELRVVFTQFSPSFLPNFPCHHQPLIGLFDNKGFVNSVNKSYDESECRLHRVAVGTLAMAPTARFQISHPVDALAEDVSSAFSLQLLDK